MQLVRKKFLKFGASLKIGKLAERGILSTIFFAKKSVVT